MSDSYWIDDTTSPEEAASVARRVSGDEWIAFNDHFFQSCCDCGLTHRVDIRNKTVGTREARFARLDTFTEQMRLRFKWENPACADEIERLRSEVARLTDERERGTAALRIAFGDELWKLGHPAYAVSHLRDELEKVSRLWKEAEVERDALLARVAAAERDAGRYRWLRDCCSEDAVIQMQDWNEDGATETYYGLRGAALDAAIDAAKERTP